MIRAQNMQEVRPGFFQTAVKQKPVCRCMAVGHVDLVEESIVDLWRFGNTDNTSCSEDCWQCIVGRQDVNSTKGGVQR